MPVSPDDARLLAKGMLELYADAELRLLDLIGRAVTRGIDTPTWREQQLLAVQKLRAQTAGLVDQLNKAGSLEAERAILTGYNRGAAVAGVDVGSAAVGFGGVDAGAVAALTAAAHAAVRQTGLVIRSQQEAIYRDVVQQTAGRMLTVGMTRRDASWDAMQTWADKGVTGFVDRGGRAWSMTSYAEMIARTASAQAIVQGHTDRLVSQGRDLVIISDAPEECERCRPWEGKVLSLTGSTPRARYSAGGQDYTVAGTLAQATAAGLFHPNCRHRTSTYLPGITPPLTDTADPEGDQLRQEHRARERRVRVLKRRAAGSERVAGKDSPQAVQARRKVRDAQAEFSQWRAEHGRKNLDYRTSIATPKARPPVPPKPELKPKRQPRPVPPDMLDWNTRELRAAGDVDLEAALVRAFEADHPNTDRLVAEVDRREMAPVREAERAEKRRAAALLRKEAKGQADADRIQALIAGGADERDAIAQVTGLSVDKQLRIELTYRLKAEGVRGNTLDEMLRTKYREAGRVAYLDAEDATNGFMLNKAGIARGIDPGSLFSGSDVRARKWASDELLEWWDQHGRVTLDGLRHDLLTGTAQRKDGGAGDYLT